MRKAYASALAVVLLDQLSKSWALHQLTAGLPQPLLPGLLRLQLVFNTGAAFSLLEGNSQALGVISLLVAVALVLWLQTSSAMGRWQALGIGLLLGGAAGNGLDRWRLGYVVDFLELVPVRFPVFNLADVAINLAVLCLAIDLLKHRGPASR